MTMTVCPHCGSSLKEKRGIVAIWLVCDCGNRVLIVSRTCISEKEMHAKYIKCYLCGGSLKFTPKEHTNEIGNKYTAYIGECACGANFKVTTATIEEVLAN